MTVTASAQQPSGDSHAEPTPASEPGPAAPKQTWADALARLGAAFAAKLTPIARSAGDWMAAASPMTLLLLLLAVLTTLSIVASLAFDNSLGVASAVFFVPALSATVGALAVRAVDERRRSQALREDEHYDAMQLRQLEQTLDYVDAKLTVALTQFGSDRHNDAVIAMFQAKAATELTRGSMPGPQPEPAADAVTTIDSASQYKLPGFKAPGALRNGEAPRGDGTRSERAGLALI